MDVFKIEDVLHHRGTPPRAHALHYNTNKQMFVIGVKYYSSPQLKEYEKKEFLKPASAAEYIEQLKRTRDTHAILQGGLGTPTYELKMVYPLLNCCFYYMRKNTAYDVGQLLSTDGNRIFCSPYHKLFPNKINDMVFLLKEGWAPSDIHMMLTF